MHNLADIADNPAAVHLFGQSDEYVKRARLRHSLLI